MATDQETPLVPPSGPEDAAGQTDLLGVYISILIRRRWWMITAFLVCVGLAFAYTKLTPPIYAPRAQVMIPSSLTGPQIRGRASSAITAVLPSPMDVLGGTSIATETEVMQSWVLRYMAAELLKKHEETVSSITEGRELVLGAADLMKPSINPDPEENDITEVGANTEAYDLLSEEKPATTAALNAVSVTNLRDTSVLEITTESRYPLVAGDVSNAVCLAYLISKLQGTRSAADSGLSYLDGQIDSDNGFTESDVHDGTGAQSALGAKQLLDEAEDSLEAFRREHGVTGGPEEAAARSRELSEARAAYLAAVSERDSLRAKLTELKMQLAESHERTTTTTQSSEGAELASLRSQLGALYGERAETLRVYTADGPEVQALNLRISSIEQEIEALADKTSVATTEGINPTHQALVQNEKVTAAELSAKAAEVRTIRDALAEAEARSAELPGYERELGTRLLDVELAEERYRSLRQKREEFRLARESQLSNVRVIAPARASAAMGPIRPRASRDLALGVVLGIIAGILLVVLVEYVDDTYPTLEALEKDLQLPVVGILPALKRNEQCIHDGELHAEFAEPMRSLWSNLQFLSPTTGLRSILVTSSIPAEGKTTMAISLALTAAKAGRSVVLVDADLRKPTVAKDLGIESDAGLSNALIGRVDARQCLVPLPVKDSAAALEILPTGPPPPNPPALLELEAFDELLAELQSRADLVIVDSPPIALFSDGQIIASKVDGVLAVFDVTGTRRDSVRGTKRQLTVSGGNVLGILANKIPRVGLGRRYYYGSDYYQDTSQYGDYYQERDAD